MILQRVLAMLILCIPGVLAIYGWTILRDSFYLYVSMNEFDIWKILLGFFSFILGISLITGFIYNHDQKKRRIRKKNTI